MLTYSSRLLSHTDFVPTFTRIDSTSRGWQGETAHVRSEMLAKHVRNLCGPIFLHCRTVVHGWRAAANACRCRSG